MAQIVCLANSAREGDRCVAGIDLETREWVRPVPSTGGGIPYKDTCIQGQPAALLDVLDIELTARNPGTRYQCENRVMRARAWRKTGQLRPRALVKFCDETAPILHSVGDRVKPTYFDSLPPDAWVSLQLVHPRKVEFHRDSYSRRRWRALFKDAKGNYYDLKLTDTVASGRLDHDEEIGSDCILTVSMTEPWSPDSVKPAMCYKLVAAVIEL